jgi:hypothetical protein
LRACCNEPIKPAGRPGGLGGGTRRPGDPQADGRDVSEQARRAWLDPVVNIMQDRHERCDDHQPDRQRDDNDIASHKKGKDGVVSQLGCLSLIVAPELDGQVGGSVYDDEEARPEGLLFV